MMSEIGLVLLASAVMAILAALVSLVLPPAFRPWWTASRGPAPDRPESGPVALTVVETEDRRGEPMPFVGKDRRKSAGQADRRPARRHGNGR